MYVHACVCGVCTHMCVVCVHVSLSVPLCTCMCSVCKHTREHKHKYRERGTHTQEHTHKHTNTHTHTHTHTSTHIHTPAHIHAHKGTPASMHDKPSGMCMRLFYSALTFYLSSTHSIYRAHILWTHLHPSMIRLHVFRAVGHQNNIGTLYLCSNSVRQKRPSISVKRDLVSVSKET